MDKCPTTGILYSTICDICGQEYGNHHKNDWCPDPEADEDAYGDDVYLKTKFNHLKFTNDSIQNILLRAEVAYQQQFLKKLKPYEKTSKM